MEQADYVHLVRLSEQESAQDSTAYRRQVAAFALLGYAWVVGCLLLALALLGWAGMRLVQGPFKGYLVWALLGGATLLWTSAGALWLRLDRPGGIPLTREQAPALFKALDRIRSKVQGPPLHAVHIDGDFNASIQQHPRFGLFGGSVNHLVIGLPLLMALDQPRLLAVLAHEYGHLRGGHGRFAAWIYRTRLSWARLHDGLAGDDNVVAAATQAFLRWYFPRFLARTFALARQDEYEADRIAGRLLGAEVAAAALVEISVKGQWLQQRFWPEHWALAATQARPAGPFAGLRRLAVLAPDEGFARDALRQALGQVSGLEDTHPGLRDRLEALGASKSLRPWSTQSSLALLGASAEPVMRQLDAAWSADNADAWRAHHAHLARVRQHLEALRTRGAAAGAEGAAVQAALLLRLRRAAEARELLEQALRSEPAHGPALRLLASVPGVEAPDRLALLDRLHAASPADRWWASRQAVDALEARAGEAFDAQGLTYWRERLRAAEAVESQAHEELHEGDWHQGLGRPDLYAFHAEELRQLLAAQAPIERAWLARKHLRSLAGRRAWLLLVACDALDDGDAGSLCDWLERSADLPGPVRVLALGGDLRLPDTKRPGLEPVYARGQ